MTNRTIYNLMGTNYASFKKLRQLVRRYAEQSRTPNRRELNELDELINDITEQFREATRTYNAALHALKVARSFYR